MRQGREIDGESQVGPGPLKQKSGDQKADARLPHEQT